MQINHSLYPKRYSFFSFFFKDFIYLFWERGEGREKKERNIYVWLPLACPQLGTQPATQASALTGNWTKDPLVHRPAFNPLSHINQGKALFFYHIKSALSHMVATSHMWLLSTWNVASLNWNIQLSFYEKHTLEFQRFSTNKENVK